MISLLSIVIGLSIIALFPTFSDAQSEQKTFVTHTGAVVKTSGEVLDPLYTESTVDFDPDEFLRNFEYGRVSISESGQTIRDYTIIAEDDGIQEISPGIFYNVWTFNGTVPGPTIRATEGDLVRVHFINNGAKEHTIHFHGIHPAGMDGVFEPVGGNGGQFIYEFEAGPVGVHPYHCHVMPLEEHIVHGL
ncbi:MAG: multicopper oxidase domain-containing protein, partial [Nitrosopumilus sp.]|nr:multicopper oxidase domain-containing protein [Nitrosopumilus sp.]NNL36800.1 multicopper oxidase domain-containing protein [Nitrosopumilus sp.]